MDEVFENSENVKNLPAEDGKAKKKNKKPMTDERKAKLLENLAKAREKAKYNKKLRDEKIEKELETEKDKEENEINNIRSLKTDINELKELIKKSNTVEVISKPEKRNIKIEKSNDMFDFIEDDASPEEKHAPTPKPTPQPTPQLPPPPPTKNIRSTIRKIRLF